MTDAIFNDDVSLSGREKIKNLFKFVQELNTLNQKPVTDVKNHLWYKPFNDIEADGEFIEKNSSAVLLRVRKGEQGSPSSALFAELYKLYNNLLRDPQGYELLIANGFVASRDNPEINHPLLTKRLRLRFAADKNEIYLEKTDRAADFCAFLFDNVKEINDIRLRERIAELPRSSFDLFESEEMNTFLRVTANSITEGGDCLYSPQGKPLDWEAEHRLLIYNEPCLIFKNRARGFVSAIDSIVTDIENGGKIPRPLLEFVQGGQRKIAGEREKSQAQQLAEASGEAVDILFAKPANKEQLQIAKRIEHYNAVVVQGPPGTGKTHTIANLLGHFIAQGKSVLVTSYTKKALSVLKEKVAESLQPLCASLLDDSNDDLHYCVDEISEYMAKHSPDELEREIVPIREDRHSLMNELSEARDELIGIIGREYDEKCIIYEDETFTPAKAAKFIAGHAEDMALIPGDIAQNIPLPLTQAELFELYRSNATLGEAVEAELEKDIPQTSDIMQPDAFLAASESLASATERINEVAAENDFEVSTDDKSKHLTLKGTFGKLHLSFEDTRDIFALKSYLAEREELKPWMRAAATDGRSAERQNWLDMTRLIAETNDYANSVTTSLFNAKITVRNGMSLEDLKLAFEEIRKGFADTGLFAKLKRSFSSHKSDSQSALASVTINGQKAASVADCDKILLYLELAHKRERCAHYWNTLLAPNSVPHFAALHPSQPEQTALKLTAKIEKYLDWYENEYPLLHDKIAAAKLPVEQIFALEDLLTPRQATERTVKTIEKTIPAICEIILHSAKISQAKSEIAAGTALLQSGIESGSAICKQLADDLARNDPKDYKADFKALNEVHRHASLLKRRRELLAELEVYAPEWAKAVRERSGVHGEALVPRNIAEAWKAKQLSLKLAKVNDTAFGDILHRTRELSLRYRELTELLSVKKGWYELMLRTKGDIKLNQSLREWEQTINQIGNGKGKMAPLYKAKARELMAECQRAVPVWIMTINDALEKFDPCENKFDVVIIDEASQADILSLAILYMGKKMIVVGDDKQVSPMAIGQDADKVKTLQDRYLTDVIPAAGLFDLRYSIYDFARQTFVPIMLREHFRCVPEIIGFTNLLSYDKKIKPLREAGSTKLLPAVVSCKVEGGARESGEKTNIKEAETIVALMKSCMEQVEYKGKTFGVISMLGDVKEQVETIQSLIDKRISPKDREERRILCGTPPHFQGDERDVIFLSLVDSKTDDEPLQTRDEEHWQKRYNVACSRAKDQLFIVHSLDAQTDLRSGDIRKALLDYAKAPFADGISNEYLAPKELSPFEAQVAADLEKRGFKLLHNIRAGFYFITSAAAYGNKKVAIECDGEKLRPTDKNVLKDMERQTVLERTGWSFIRIRAGEYYGDREKTIERVAAELSSLGIEPNTLQSADAHNTELLKRVKERAALIISEQPESDKEEARSSADE